MRRAILGIITLVLVGGGGAYVYHVESAGTAHARTVHAHAVGITAAHGPTLVPRTTSPARPSPTARSATPPPPRPTPTGALTPTAPALTHTATPPPPTRTVPPPPTPTVMARPTATPAPPAPAVPLQLGPAQFSLFIVNPQFTRQQVSFTLSAPALVRVRIAQPGDVRHVRTLDLGTRPAGTVHLSWDGRDNAHRLVPEGSYSYTITATDARGAPQTATYNELGITYKRIVISLSKQQLWAFDGAHYVLSTLVTTGNAALPTPQGVFPILGKYSPFTFISPWPYGSKYYFAPSPVSYALLFDDRGYYIHDAPWRGIFGPGSNTTLGTPGLNYTGSHGCVNVPLPMEQQLYAWATVGTVVQVVR